jgi:hypothetical protein
MDGPCRQSLTGPGFSRYQHGEIRHSYFYELPLCTFEGLAGADERLRRAAIRQGIRQRLHAWIRKDIQ